MKTNSTLLVTLGAALALTVLASAQDAPKPAEAPAPAAAPAAPAPAAPPKAAPVENIAPEKPLPPLKEGELRLNFRGAPLDMVLNYLSEAAGFTIVLEAPARGTVDVWSSQPVTKQEAVDLLNSVLSRNGLTALQNGRTLTILTKDEAKKRDIEITSASDPNLIPKTDKIVTHILPVRYINAPQALRDLSQLLPADATIAANEAGNSLIITAKQMDIRRIAEIINALDNAVSGVATIKVFPLKYADAKTMAATVKELFAGGSSSSDPRSAMASFIASRFGGGGGPGGGPGGPGGGGGPGGDRGSRSSSGGASSSRAQAKLVATADEFSNSLIVSAPDEMITSVTELVEKIDQPVEDLTEIKVFRLKNADPTEMATLLTQLFPDPNSSRNSSTSSRFGGSTPPGIPSIPGSTSRSSGGGGSSSSDRMLKQTKVTAVADPRTSSIIITASKDLMAQIIPMVDKLDSDPAKKQKVFVYDINNADVGQMEQLLQSLFQSQNGSSSTGGRTTSGRSGSTQSTPLTTRANQTQTGSTGTGLGGGSSSGGGNSGGGRGPTGFQ